MLEIVHSFRITLNQSEICFSRNDFLWDFYAENNLFQFLAQQEGDRRKCSSTSLIFGPQTIPSV